ncbi:MAG TPA: radical SAM protein [Candidatus Bathyarchaeia archaeon]|nr:radical SAM protein [Candidatus Bathyarchaeia archaeon]
MPVFVRVSLGSAMVLGLAKGKMDIEPSTIYLLTYKAGRCKADCGFCAQARSSASRVDLLSRVSWPKFPTENVLNALESSRKEGPVKRVCIQSLNYPGAFDDVLALIREIFSRTRVAISLSCQPVNKDQLRLLAESGLDRIGIPLDAASEGIFDIVKGAGAGGPYIWGRHLETIEEAVKIFGKDRVSTHIMVGLGERDADIAQILDKMVRLGVCPALFAFTPVKGTRMEGVERPALRRYRRIQLARYLLVNSIADFADMKFDKNGTLTDLGIPREQVTQAIMTGKPFMTSGCPDCDRPYYNEEPKGPLYNFPRRLGDYEISRILSDMLSEKEGDLDD